MREERQDKPPIKACPYWARYAEGPNGWIIAFCSYKACQEEENRGRIWEGPQKTGECLLNYSPRAAIVSPSIIVYNTADLLGRSFLDSEHYHCQAPETIDDNLWNEVVRAFYLHSQDWKTIITIHLDNVFAEKIGEILFRPLGDN